MESVPTVSAAIRLILVLLHIIMECLYGKNKLCVREREKKGTNLKRK